MNKTETIYLAGPMRGHVRFNFDAFHAAEEQLTQKGYVVHNPARVDEEEGFNPNTEITITVDMSLKFFERDIELIKKSDSIVLLPGWEQSVGANAEHWIARWLDKGVYLYPEMLSWADGHMPPPSREDILEEALRITKTDRNNSYGPPTKDFARTAQMWSAILDIQVEAKDVALCMLALKISRATWSDKRDHWVDMGGYARCGWLCVTNK